MIRFAVIGTNWITDEFLKGAFTHPEFELVAVYSRTKEKGMAFAEKHSARLVFTSLEELGNCDEIDAVYIASPNSLHAEQSMTLMRHGKHILCEKPLASNASEVELMFQTSREQNVLLMEAMKTTFLPNFQAIEENIHKIGKVRRYTANYNQYSSRYDSYKSGTVLNAFKPELSNGSLMDIGVYCVYPMIKLFGSPKGIQANGLMLDSGIDGQGSILADYGDFEGVITHSKITNSYSPSEIQGELGSIVLDRISRTSSVKIHYNDGTVEDISRVQDKHPMYYELAHFVSLIQRGEFISPVNSYENSLNTIKVLDKARKCVGLEFPADIKR